MSWQAIGGAGTGPGVGTFRGGGGGGAGRDLEARVAHGRFEPGRTRRRPVPGWLQGKRGPPAPQLRAGAGRDSKKKGPAGWGC